MIGAEYRLFWEDLRARVLSGETSYDDAKIEAAPVLEEMNRRARAIAKKHGVRPRPFSFSGFMR